MIMIFTLCLCLCPSLLSCNSSLFFFLLILFKLKSSPAVCHYDTITASHPPSLFPLSYLELSVSFLPARWSERNAALYPFYKTFLPTPSLHLFYFMLVQPLPNHRLMAPGLSFSSSPHLFLLTMLRLGCLCHLTSQSYFIYLDSLFFHVVPLCYFGTVRLVGNTDL